MKNKVSVAMLSALALNISGAVGLLHRGDEGQVGHNGKYFTVTEHDRSYRVGKESLDGTLRNVNRANMAMFMKRGRISSHKLSDGNYMLRGHVNGLGGGPIAGWIAYWGTKALCYGTAAAAAGTVVVATGGAAGAAVGAGVAFGTATASTGATVVAAAIGGAGLAGEAVAVSTSAVAAFGGLAGTAAAIETGATTLGYMALACPFLP